MVLRMRALPSLVGHGSLLLFTIGASCAVAPIERPVETQVQADGTRTAYPPLPDSILSPVGWTKVHRRPAQFQCGHTSAIGCYTYETRRLEVGRLDSRDSWHVLYHEEFHMAMGDAGLTHVGTEAQQDSMADAVATVRVLERLTNRCR